MEENKEQLLEKRVLFAAINPDYVTNIVSSKEENIDGRDFVIWGTRNQYPHYVAGLCEDVTLLRSLINGFCDYVAGENISINFDPWKIQVNGDGDTIEDIVRKISFDYARIGGFALNVIRNRMGGVAEIYYIDVTKLRTDKKNEFFRYSEDWNKSYGRCKYTTYAKFRPNGQEASSIFYYKNNPNTAYPQPLFAGDGVIAAETEKSIQEYNLNNIKNGFAGSHIINFNNGQPTDEEKEEIEDNVIEKFCGESNAGRILVSFNDSKDRAVTIEKLESDNFADKFMNLKKSCEQTLFTAFRATPCLFGLPSEGSGFNKEDYGESFKIFNKVVVMPFQKIVKRTFERILGMSEVVTIEPIDIDFSRNAVDNNNVL